MSDLQNHNRIIHPGKVMLKVIHTHINTIPEELSAKKQRGRSTVDQILDLRTS